MFTPRRPLLGQRHERFSGVRHAVSTAQRSVAFIAAMLTLFVLLSTGAAQACQLDNSRTMHAEQHGTQGVVKSSAALDPVVKFVVKNISDKGLVPISYDNRSCGYTSCLGSSAAILVENSAPLLGDIRRADFPLLQTHLSSTRLYNLFRPPRFVF